MRLFSLVLCLALVARAQAAPTANDNEAAKAHFMAGSAYYEQANYSDAVKEFNEAYRLSQRPDLLYNIALAYERLEKWDQAIDALNRYLTDKPDAQDRNIIQQRLDNMEKRREAAKNAPPPSTAPAPVVAAPPPPKPRHIASGIVLGLGAAALVAAIGTGSAALVIQNDLQSCANKMCPTSKKDEPARGTVLAHATDGLIAVGAAAVIVGVVLLVVESRRPSPKTAFVAPAPGGLAVTW